MSRSSTPVPWDYEPARPQKTKGQSPSAYMPIDEAATGSEPLYRTLQSNRHPRIETGRLLRAVGDSESTKVYPRVIEDLEGVDDDLSGLRNFGPKPRRAINYEAQDYFLEQDSLRRTARHKALQLVCQLVIVLQHSQSCVVANSL